jgi:hypothetical protein
MDVFYTLSRKPGNPHGTEVISKDKPKKRRLL